MAESRKDELSELINGYIGGKQFKSLSSILKNSGFYNQSKNKSASIINSLEDSDYKSLKKNFNNLRKLIVNEIHEREDQNKTNDKVDSFLQFASLIFDVSTIIQRHDEQTISNLKETQESQGDSLTSKSKAENNSDSKQKSTNDQSEAISKLKRKLAKANQQITFLKAQISLAKDEGKNEVIQDISDHYHLEHPSGNDLQSLINSLDNCIESNASTIPSDSGENLNDNLSVVKKIVKSFDLPPETTPQNIVTELKQKIVEIAKFKANMNSQLKEELENAPIGPNEDPENPSIMRSQLVATINNLRSELDQMRSNLAQQDEVLQVFCNIPLKPNEVDAITQEVENTEKSFIQKVRDIVSILAIQIFQSEDTEVTNKRLFSLVSGLFQFINCIGTSKAAYVSLYSEAPFEEMRSVLLSQAERVHLFLSENGQAFSQDQQSLFNELITTNNYNPLKGIDSNSVQSANLLTHVKNFLSEYTQRPSTVEGQVLYVIALEAVCACDILSRYSETVKHAFTKQIHESKQLKDYSIKLEKSIEDQAIYYQNEISNIQNDDRNSRGENYEYGDNYYDNDRESFSNENSMNYNNTANSSRINDNRNSNSRSNENSMNLNSNSRSNENSRDNDNGRRRRENSRNRNVNTNNNDNNENKRSNENSKDRDQNENELNTVRSILRKGITDHKESKNKDQDCKCIESILEALDHLNQKQIDAVPDDRYIQTLQSQLQAKINENKELKEKNDNLIKETHDDIVKVQTQLSKMNETMNQRIEVKKKQNQKLVKALKDAKDSMVKLKKENKQLQEKLEQSASQESEESKQIVDEIQHDFMETKKEHQKIVSQLTSNLEEKQKKLDELKGYYEKEIEKLNKNLEDEKHKSESFSKKAEQFDSVKTTIDKLKKKEAKAIDQASLISQKYQEALKDNAALEKEKKAISDKFQNIEKEKELIQASLKNYSETLNEYEKLRKSYDQLRNDKVKENQQLLSEILALFPSYVDLSDAITRDSVIEVLKNVKNDLDSLSKAKGKAEKKDSIIQQVKESLNIESEKSIVDKLNNLIKTNNELDQSNQMMYSELKASQESRFVYLQLQDWLIRMYVLVTGGVCQDVTTLEMQHAIEDNITSKYENLVLSRKNALLKAEKKLLQSKAFNKVNKDYMNENETPNDNTTTTNNNESKVKDNQNEEEEDQNQSSTEIEFDAKNVKENTTNNTNNNNKKKKKKDKSTLTFRHLLIMAMLICKAKRLSGNGEDPFGLEISDANAMSNREGRQYSASLSPISKPTNSSNYVFGLD